MAPRRLSIAAAVLLAISLIAHLPARQLLPEGPVGLLTVERIHGHWRSGGLHAVLPTPAPAITVAWRLELSRLLLMQLRYELVGSGVGLSARGWITVAPSQPPVLDQVVAVWQAEGMPLLGPFRGSASFSAHLRDVRLVADATTIHQASGRLILRGLRIETLGQSLILGDFSAEISVSEGALHLPVVTEDAPLEVRGDLYLSLDGHLWGDLIVRPDARTPEALAIGVTAIGRPLSDGRYRIGIDLRL